VFLVDSHTHLYAEEFDGDRDEMMHRALENHVSSFFLPAIDSKYHGRMMQVAAEYPQHCHPMMGLHPTSVKENFQDELKIVSEHLADPSLNFSAVGEIGIDLYRDRTHEKQQFDAFGYQLDLALKYDLPVVIHTRNSMDIALSLVGELHDPGIRGVFHCFSGNLQQAQKAVSLGFMLGIGGVVTYKNSDLQEVVRHTALEHLLLETDAPWLPPVPYRGQRNEPSYLPVIARKIDEIKDVTPDKVAEVTAGNAWRLFGRGEPLPRPLPN